MASSLYDVNLLVFLLLASCSVFMAFDGSLKSRTCNGELYSWSSDYEAIVESTLEDLIANTWKSSLLDYYCQHTYSVITVYGHGVCTSSLSPDDCYYCIRHANKELFRECTHSIGAQVQLMDCRLRYENYKFNNDE